MTRKSKLAATPLFTAILLLSAIGALGCSGSTWQDALIDQSESEYAPAFGFSEPLESEDDVDQYVKDQCIGIAKLPEIVTPTFDFSFDEFVEDLKSITGLVPEDALIEHYDALDEALKENCGENYKETSQLLTGTDSLYSEASDAVKKMSED